MRFTLNAILFLLGFALTCGAIEMMLPPPKVPIVSVKLDYLASHAGEFDTLLLGSSRTFRQIIPEIFDAEMAAGGFPVRSFNLGIDGMRPPEDTYLLEKVLALRRKPLRFVVVECNALRLKPRPEDRDTVRVVYWHDWRRLVALYRNAFLSDPKKRSWRGRFEKIGETFPDFWEHARYFAQKSTSQGRAHEMLYEWISPVPIEPPPLWDLGARLDGYKPAPQSEQEMSAREQALYASDMAKMRDQSVRQYAGDPASQDEVAYKKQLIEAAGAKMILVIPPYLGERFFVPDPKSGVPPALNFANPESYPELFAPEHRADAGHTNTAGSRIFTRLVVKELLHQINASPGK